MALNALHTLYTGICRPVLFRLKPEAVHNGMTSLGGRLGRSRLLRRVTRAAFCRPDPSLEAEVAGIRFRSPLGLAAGFDYEARLPEILPALGFGFGTVGTLTHRPYGGNPGPMLGRLPRSRALMVNKGFKNHGVAATLAGWRGTRFEYPVGVSVGKTNDPAIATHEDAVADVVAGFRDAEASAVGFAYYELNISCPNLLGSVDFYNPRRLVGLLAAVRELRLTRPVFVKMPIAKPDGDITAMLDVIADSGTARGVIIGNVQTDRAHPALVPDEVARWPRGNFSGLPCRDRSDALIASAYRSHGKRLVIIGCGGTFSAEDAYRKITAGASLVQLITGLIYEGPQLVAQINRDLAGFLRRDGFASLAAAVGTAV